MTQGTLKIEIDKKITDAMLIETCMMYHHSGYDFMIMISFYALAKRWNINKLLYYIKLIKNEPTY